MLRLKDASKYYLAGEIETTALNKINIDIATGEFVAITGPSGCGKSTLLNIIGMLDHLSEGEYSFMDENISGYSEAKLANIRKHHIGFIFQSFNLIDELNVEENIELALIYHKISVFERKKRVATAMEKMGIAHRAKHFPSQLSGGQQQRVAIARAVVGNQSIIIADEPTGNLDSVHGNEVMSLLKGLNDEGSTIIMVTHTASHTVHANRIINIMDGCTV